MKKFYFLLILIITANVGWAQLYESFNYTSGQNVGGNCTTAPCSNNNWTTHSNSGGATGTIDVLSGSLSYTGLQAPSGNMIVIPGNNTTTTRDVNIPASIAPAASIGYYSFLIKILDNTQLVTSYNVSNYFLSFGSLAGSSGGTAFGRVIAKSVNAGANFRLGIHGAGGGTVTVSEVATDLNFNATYLVVAKYEITATGNDITTIWVNPSSLGGSESAGGVSNSSGSSTVSTFASVVITNGVNTPNAEIDEIRAGTTWASVTPPPPPPVITSFTPTMGYIGTSVVITGANFSGATAVTFGGTNAASFTVDNDTQITSAVGIGATGVISVTTPYGTGLSGSSFTHKGYITNAAGNWSNGSTWLGGVVPPPNSDVTLAHAVSFDVSATVNNFTLSAGLITLGSNNLTVAGTITGGSLSNHVVTNGAGRLTINNVSSLVTFPVGPGGGLYHPVTINNSGTPDNFSVKVTSAVPVCLPASTSVNATWDITEATAGSSNCTITLNYSGATVGGAYTPVGAQITHCNGATVDYHNGSVTGTVATGSGFTNFSPFGINSNSAVLPVTLINFAGSKCSSGVCLLWTTENEQNVLDFEAEKSSDARNFEKIAIIIARNTGNSSTYSAPDNTPSQGIGYYRLKTVYKDGKMEYSKIIKFDFSKKLNLLISPNPARNIISISGLEGANQLTLLNQLGQIVKTIKTTRLSETIDLLNLPAGIYTLHVLQNNKVFESIKVVKD